MYNVAVVGTGFIARKRHIPAWRRLYPGVRIAAVCDGDILRARAVAADFGVPAAFYKVSHMLEEARPDFVDVCTPPDGHADITIAALEAGAHVLVEKPLAATVEECQRIIEAERRSDGRVGVAHSELFYPPVIEARRRVESGEIGDVTGMRIFRSTPVSAITADPDHWANRLPCGAVGETGPHVVYLTQAFIEPIRNIRVNARKLLPQYPWSPFEDYRLELAGDDATCSAVLTYTNRHAAAHVDIWGTEGMLRMELQSRVLVNYDRLSQNPAGIGASALKEATGMIASVAATVGKHLLGRLENAHDVLIREFFERTQRGLVPSVTSQDGLKTVQVMDLICSQLSSPGCGAEPPRPEQL